MHLCSYYLPQILHTGPRPTFTPTACEMHKGYLCLVLACKHYPKSQGLTLYARTSTFVTKIRMQKILVILRLD
jgi:hypothetical protein